MHTKLVASVEEDLPVGRWTKFLKTFFFLSKNSGYHTKIEIKEEQPEFYLELHFSIKDRANYFGVSMAF